MNLQTAEQREINLNTAFGELKGKIGLYKVFYFRIAKIISY